MRKLREASIKGKKVLLRVDFNLPLNPQGQIEDDSRLKAALPTLRYLIQVGAKKIILVSHLGRPVLRPGLSLESIIAGNSTFTLRKIAERLAERLGVKNKIVKERIDHFVLPAYKIKEKIFLLENIRFSLKEEKNDPEFSQKLASLADLFVNDAFGVSHHEHASVVGVTKYLPSYAGFLVEKEVENLSLLSHKPEHPFVLILGGAKILEKMLVLNDLIKKVDFVLLGGVMANTFLASRKIELKESAVEKERLELASELFDRASRKIILPTDLVWDSDRVVDIGPGTILHYQRIIRQAKTVFWNGTMGLTSLGIKSFRKGTEEIAKAIAESKAKSLVCGGDTLAEIYRLKIADKINFISTGGGATLEFLAGEKLPGLEALA